MSTTTDHDLLVRIAERVDGIAMRISQCQRECVTQKEFDPIRRIVYGLVGVILLAVMTALIGTTLTRARIDHEQVTSTADIEHS